MRLLPALTLCFLSLPPLMDPSPAPLQGYIQHAGGLEFLRPFNDKYPQAVKLFKNPALKTRLQKLLGGNFGYLVKDIFQVEIPIRIEGDYFYAWGMQTHSGGNPSAKLIADLGKNKLYVEILKNKQTLFYAEDGSKSLPAPLDAWVNKQSANQ